MNECSYIVRRTTRTRRPGERTKGGACEHLNENAPVILNRKILCVLGRRCESPRAEGHLTAEHETPVRGEFWRRARDPAPPARIAVRPRPDTRHLLGTRPPRSTYRRPTDAPTATRTPGLGAQAALVALAVALVWTIAHPVAVLTALALLAAAAVAAALDDRGRRRGRPAPLAE